MQAFEPIVFLLRPPVKKK
jgi:SURF1 family